MALHKLQSQWTLWELKEKHAIDSKDYGKLLREICEFSTVEDFWKYWMFIPKPSEVFGDGQTKVYVEGRIIKAFGMFKKGIEPTWEDPANKSGCELVALKQFNSEVLDMFWENLVLGLIGETIDDGDEICGCRIVNQTRKSKPTYKIELWLRSSDDVVANRIRAKLCEALTDGESSKPQSKVRAPEFEIMKRGK